MRPRVAIGLVALELAAPVFAEQPVHVPASQAWAMPERELMVPVQGAGSG